MWPHDVHIRRCTQVPPLRRHSAQPAIRLGGSMILIVLAHLLSRGSAYGTPADAREARRSALGHALEPDR